jgi:hypothetical protein
MKFEHLIEINDPLNPLIDPLTRDQLWNGLLAYIEDPVPFLLGLDRCTIAAREEHEWKRELEFGRMTVRDKVRFGPKERIRIDTEPSAQLPAGALTLTIEQPSAAQLFLRFVYETFPQGHEVAAPEYQGVVKQAYRQAGIDIVQRIRELAGAGALG